MASAVVSDGFALATTSALSAVLLVLLSDATATGAEAIASIGAEVAAGWGDFEALSTFAGLVSGLVQALLSDAVGSWSPSSRKKPFLFSTMPERGNHHDDYPCRSCHQR